MRILCRMPVLAATVSAVLGTVTVWMPPPAIAGASPDCAVPAALMEDGARLPHLRARLAARRPVAIVAIGGASTAGKAAGSPDLAYPRRLQEALARRYPARAITVLNKGAPRQSAQDMLARFPRDVLAAHPALVIWEVGITDAVRGTDIDDFAAALQAGVDRLEARGIDVMLVDMQFSRNVTAIIDFDDYLNALRRTAEINGLYVFPRFEMMRYWSERGVFDFESAAPAERARLAASVYRCLGDRLADAIWRAAR
jgi:acyl-CoA thioesterase-1